MINRILVVKTLSKTILLPIREHMSLLFSIHPEEMGQRLDDYCDEHFGDLVRILRAPTRLGLIKAKNYGARNGSFRIVDSSSTIIRVDCILATGDVIVFLDAHCEANTGW
jgi:hypothetical protein